MIYNVSIKEITYGYVNYKIPVRHFCKLTLKTLSQVNHTLLKNKTKYIDLLI